MTRPTVRVEAARLNRLLDAAELVIADTTLLPDGTYQAPSETVARLLASLSGFWTEQSDKPEFCPNCRTALTVREEAWPA